MYDRRTFVNDTQMRYIFNGGVPIGVNYYIAPYFDFSDRTEVHAVYVQDQWTHGRMTHSGRAALRPRRSVGAGRQAGFDGDVALQSAAARASKTR